MVDTTFATRQPGESGAPSRSHCGWTPGKQMENFAAPTGVKVYCKPTEYQDVALYSQPSCHCSWVEMKWIHFNQTGIISQTVNRL